MQNSGKHILPRWLSYGLLILFVGHFLMLAVFQFSGTYLDLKYYYLTKRYVSPWFYQNWRVFAPEPPTERRMFVYRVKNDSVWSSWNYPAFPFLQEHWSNRFSTASEMHDMIEALADNLVFTARRSDVGTYDKLGQWESLPAFKSAKKYILQHEPESDSLQFAVLIEHHILIENHLDDAYSLYPFQKIKGDEMDK